jgi:hypothetical protein
MDLQAELARIERERAGMDKRLAEQQKEWDERRAWDKKYWWLPGLAFFATVISSAAIGAIVARLIR